jgi:hypothetical protein
VVLYSRSNSVTSPYYTRVLMLHCTRYSQKITGKVVLQCGLLRQWRKYLLKIQRNPPAVQCTFASGKPALGCQKKRTLVVDPWATHAPPTGHRHRSWICVLARTLSVVQTDEKQTAQVWVIRRVWQDLKLHVSQRHHGGICCVRPGIVLLETDAFGQETPTLAADSWPQMVLQ